MFHPIVPCTPHGTCGYALSDMLHSLSGFPFQISRGMIGCGKPHGILPTAFSQQIFKKATAGFSSARPYGRTYKPYWQGNCRVGKYRLTVFLWQVCTVPPQNRAYNSRCTRLRLCLVNKNSLVVNPDVASLADYKSFSPFGYHRTFPILFSFQIFEFVDVMNLIAVTFGCATQFTSVCL